MKEIVAFTSASWDIPWQPIMNVQGDSNADMTIAILTLNSHIGWIVAIVQSGSVAKTPWT